MTGNGEFRIVVTGSRVLPESEYGAIYRRLAEFADKDREGVLVVVAHGAAKGADAMADRAARELGYHVRKYPAAWAAMGRRAGMVRNEMMLDSEKPDVVLAWPLGESRGTRGCIEMALDRGLYVEIREAVGT